MSTKPTEPTGLLDRTMRLPPWPGPLLTGLLTGRVNNFRQMWRRLQVYDLMAILVPRGGIEPPTP
jgi:hypothetical protein